MPYVRAGDIFSDLRKIAPNLSFSTKWTEDPSFVWDGDGPDPAEQGMVAYDVDVFARAIIDGIMAEGRESLGGCYDEPHKRDPDIHGYLPQMLEEATQELSKSVSGPLQRQCAAAIKYLKGVMRQNYEAERRAYSKTQSRRRR